VWLSNVAATTFTATTHGNLNTAKTSVSNIPAGQATTLTLSTGGKLIVKFVGTTAHVLSYVP